MPAENSSRDWKEHFDGLICGLSSTLGGAALGAIPTLILLLSMMSSSGGGGVSLFLALICLVGPTIIILWIRTSKTKSSDFTIGAVQGAVGTVIMFGLVVFVGVSHPELFMGLVSQRGRIDLALGLTLKAIAIVAAILGIRSFFRMYRS